MIYIKENEKATEKEENLENSTTTQWLKANRRGGMVLRRSTRARKTTEHFEPEPSPPRLRSPSRIEKTPPIQEKTPPPNQTPPPTRKRGRPPSATKKNKEPSPIPQTPKKRGRPSAARKDDQQ
jgi:hypothetical protein